MAASEALLTIPEVAARLAVSEVTVRRRIKGKEITHVRLGGVIRIQPSAVDEYVARMVVPAAQLHPPRERMPRRRAARSRQGGDDPLSVLRRLEATEA